MKFRDYLNQYMEMLECSAKELADACGLSSAVNSRYRTGEREPAPDSEQLQKLTAGLAALFKTKSIPDLSAAKLRTELEHALNQKNTNFENFVTNFDRLISALNFKNASAFLLRNARLLCRHLQLRIPAIRRRLYLSQRLYSH